MQHQSSRITLFVPMVAVAGSVAVLGITGHLFVALSLVLAAVAVLGLRSGSAHGGILARRLWVPAPTAGIVPVVAAHAVVQSGHFAHFYLGAPNPASPFIVAFAVFLVTHVLLSRLAFPADEMREIWGRIAGHRGDDAFKRRYRKAHLNSLVWGLGTLGVVELSESPVAIFVVLALIVGTAVILDIGGEMDFRREHGFYVTVFNARKVRHVPAPVAILDAHGIKTYVRGIKLRQVLGGLSVKSEPLEVMIPAVALDEAIDALREAGLGTHDGLIDIEEKSHTEADHDDQPQTHG